MNAEVPTILYRAYGESSGSTFSETTGFVARDSASDYKIDATQLGNHLCWGLRKPTVFVSTTSSYDNASTMVNAIRKWYGKQEIVYIAKISTRGMSSALRPYHMLSLAEKFSVDVERKARNAAEYLFVQHIPVAFVAEVYRIGAFVSALH
ncbi:hypothetical protein B0H10DRAFT_2223974 [Mycena sp. CBHHK59/15]|nr:hypothetical protein B0H10DRAFT_2223974 [Mycena sp. CBHHK59/15]